jgi:serine/threonine-protein kinase HipA
LIPEDIEQTALAINGKKNKIHKKDWIALATHMGLKEIFVENMIKKYKRSIPKMFKLIDNSFLTLENKERLKEIMNKNLSQLD